MILTRATDNRLKAFFHRRRGPVRGERVSGQGLSIARPGSDLRAPPCGCAAARRDYRAADDGVAGRRHRPMIRDLGATLAMRPEPATVRMVLNAQMGKAGPPTRGQGPAHRRFRLGHPAASRAADDRDADDRRHGDGVLARRLEACRGLVHRRRRIVARRMARGDQPLRRAQAAGDLLRAEQSDRAVDAGLRAVGGARVRRQGRRLRHAGHHASTAPIPRRSRRRSPGPPSGRARASGRRSSSSSPCACAATRTTTTCSTSAGIRRRRGTYPPLTDQGYANRELYEYWAARDPIAAVRGAAAGRRHRRSRRCRALQARGRGDRRSARRGR